MTKTIQCNNNDENDNKNDNNNDINGNKKYAINKNVVLKSILACLRGYIYIELFDIVDSLILANDT